MRGNGGERERERDGLKKERQKEREINSPISSINQAGGMPRTLESIHEDIFS